VTPDANLPDVTASDVTTSDVTTSTRAAVNLRRATPIAAGAAVRVVAIDGLLLEVAPETGGARDAHH